MSLKLKWCFPVFALMCNAFVSNAQADSSVVKKDSIVSTPSIVTNRVIPAVRRPIIKKPKPIRTEFSGGFRLNSDGWSLFADKGYVVSEDRKRDYFYDVRLFQVELQEKKHPKEIKRTNNLGTLGDDRPKPFIYGKVNNFYALKLGYGKRKMIAGKPEPGTVSIHWVYLGGLSVGMLKPYYLQTVDPATKMVEDTKFSDTTQEQFLSRNLILGSSGFSKGLGEIGIVPGIHFKTALHFDFANTKTNKLAIETGINAELYTKKIELMALQDAVPYFVNIYAAIQFGKRKQ